LTVFACCYTTRITGDEASALLDVLDKRHYLKDLLEWLARRIEPWSRFFVDREQRHAALRQTDEEWLKQLAQIVHEEATSTDGTETLGRGSKEILTDCPAMSSLRIASRKN